MPHTRPLPPSTSSTSSTPSSQPQKTRGQQRYRALRWWIVAWGIVGVLWAVFALYIQPQFMLTVADQVWACF